MANDACEALLGAHAALMREFESDAQVWGDLGEREYDVLYTLARAGGALSLRELNRGVLLSQPALSRMVGRLVSRGLLERRPDPADARAVQIGLTEDGRRRQREVGLRHGVQVTRAMQSGLSDAELAELRRLCIKLAHGMDRRQKPLGRSVSDE
ncbi:MAG: MarR family transcriptional regulator [Microbacteriaceae bacterium]|jgi:DNA-binding MarR family transcriptional regulator|nr:MarR family transcriptional regulator [Microbacteriaceae bacterium]